MREIKFRAWDKKEKRMFIVENLRIIRDVLVNQDRKYSVSERGYVCRNKTEIMQFTGLKDKNGKEIYEGDILLKNNGDRFLVFWNNDALSYFVKNLRTGFENMLDLHKEPISIFGNIYENPELLEEVK